MTMKYHTNEDLKNAIRLDLFAQEYAFCFPALLDHFRYRLKEFGI
jgi:hypothetical protein